MTFACCVPWLWLVSYAPVVFPEAKDARRDRAGAGGADPALVLG